MASSPISHLLPFRQRFNKERDDQKEAEICDAGCNTHVLLSEFSAALALSRRHQFHHQAADAVAVTGQMNSPCIYL